jgi:hypothetical protein
MVQRNEIENDRQEVVESHNRPAMRHSTRAVCRTGTTIADQLVILNEISRETSTLATFQLDENVYSKYKDTGSGFILYRPVR